MRKNWLLSLFIVVIVSVLSACGGNEEVAEGDNEEVQQGEEAAEGNETPPAGGENPEQPEMPEPDLEGIPDAVAEVNGIEITKEEFEATYVGQFQQMAIQSMMVGQEINQAQLKQQIVESMVGQQLLIQQVNNSELEATQEEIDEVLNTIAQQNGLETKEEFLAAIKEQGINEEEVMSLAETQAKLNQYIANESGSLEPTDEEVKEAYDTIVAQQEEMGGDQEIPSFEEIKPDIQSQVKMQKENEAVESIVNELREQGEVTIYL